MSTVLEKHVLSPERNRGIYQAVKFDPYYSHKIFTIRIQAIRTEDDDHSQPTDGTDVEIPKHNLITNEQVGDMILKLNALYEPCRIHFAYDPDEDFTVINNTHINRDGGLKDPQSIFGVDKPELCKEANDTERQKEAMKYLGKLVLFFSHGYEFTLDESIKKWKLVPRGGGYSNGRDYYVSLPLWLRPDTKFYAHEIGHYFHLGHTFGWHLPEDPDTPQKAQKALDDAAEVIRRGVENGSVAIDDGLNVFDGDAETVTDTAPDAGPLLWKAKGWTQCGPETSLMLAVEFSEQFEMQNGIKRKLYALTPDQGNIMSYFVCTPARFSPQQITRMHRSMEHGNRQHLIGRPPTLWSPPGPTIVSWGSDRLDIFAQAGDACLYHKCFSNGVYSPDPDWRCLGGYISGKPSAVSWEYGRFDLFARSIDGNLLHKGFKEGLGWFPSKTSWNDIGGRITDSAAVVSWGAGRLDLFVRGRDGCVWHKGWEDGLGWFPSMADWENIGGQIVDSPSAVSWGPGRLDVFVQGRDGCVWHKGWENGIGWFPSGTDWENIGGQITGPPSVVSWGPGRLDIFTHGRDGGVWHKGWEDGIGWFPSVVDWENIGGQIAGSPSVVSWGPGRLDIFVHGKDGRLWHKVWTNDNGWSPSQLDWSPLGGQMIDSPSTVSFGPGRLDVVVRNNTNGLWGGSIWHKTWDDSIGWVPSQSDWIKLDHIVYY